MARMLWVTCSRCPASRCHILLNLLQARYHLWGAAWATLGRLVVGVVEALLHPLERLFSLGGSLGGSALFAGHGGRDGFAQLMLHMEHVRRVMRSKVMFNIRQQSRGFITGRLDHRAVETRKGLFHQGIPGVLIPCLGRLLQDLGVAPSLDPNHTQTTRKGFILRHRDVFGWHLASQARTLLVAVRHDRLFNTTVDLLLRPIGGANNPMQARDLQ